MLRKPGMTVMHKPALHSELCCQIGIYSIILTKRKVLLSGRRRHTSILLHKKGRKKLTFTAVRKYLNILKT